MVMAAFTCHPSTWEVETESECPGHHQQHSSQASLTYMRPDIIRRMYKTKVGVTRVDTGCAQGRRFNPQHLQKERELINMTFIFLNIYIPKYVLKQLKTDFFLIQGLSTKLRLS